MSSSSSSSPSSSSCPSLTFSFYSFSIETPSESPSPLARDSMHPQRHHSVPSPLLPRDRFPISPPLTLSPLLSVLFQSPLPLCFLLFFPFSLRQPLDRRTISPVPTLSPLSSAPDERVSLLSPRILIPSTSPPPSTTILLRAFLE